MPGRFSADPSGLLVFVAPILFGYMFGDVVQGLALIVIGLALQWRWPMLRLLVVGGLAAMVFGFVFGAAGGIHGAFTALWVDPLDDPLPVLLVPIAFGGPLLTLGLALNGLEAYWSGRLLNWLRCDAGFLALYVGLLLALMHPAGWFLVMIGLGIQVLGRLWQERRVGALFASVGEIVEKLLQISINTLSFVRVGAFALAHAGLSSALVSMAMAVVAAILGTVVSALLFWVKDAAAQGVPAHYSLPPDVWRWALASAAAATGISTAAAAHAVAKLGSAAIGALAENPDLFGRLLIFVGLAEGIAIYGLIISVLILNRLA